MVRKEPDLGEKGKLAQRLNDFGRYSGLGVAFAATFLCFGFIGYLLDQWLGTMPLMLLLGIFSGATLGFLRLYLSVFPQTPTDDPDHQDKQ